MEQIERSELSETPIDIKEYFYLLWSWVWLIVLAGILAGAAAYVYSIRTIPVYQATTRLLVSVPSTIGGVDPSAMVTTQTMTSTYSEMLLDRPVLQGVIDQLKLQTTPDELKKSIKVDIVINTQLLVVSVENTNPARAADIANEMATEFTDRIRELQAQRFAASRDGLTNQVIDIEKQITNTNYQISYATDPSTLQQLQARLTQYQTIYSTLVTTYEQVRLAEEQTSTNVVVSEPANIPTIPVIPKTAQNTLLSFIVVMLLATGMLFAHDALDDTIKNPEEIRKKFKLPILGVIDVHEVTKDKPITAAEPRSPTAEAFRSLRTNITFASVDRPLRRILVTSPMPADGKTTVVCNLGVVLAQGEKKTLLIDADLRRPSIQTQFGLPNRVGLTDMFVRPLEAFSIVTQSDTAPRLAIITSGNLPPNPSELLSSKMMSELLDRLNQVFDVIVIDSPPVLTVTDAVALAPTMDGVILVIKPGVTKLSVFQQALEQLHSVGAHVLGVVLNGVEPTNRKYGYYYNRYYSKYSQYYGGYGTKQKKMNPESSTQEKSAEV